MKPLHGRTFELRLVRSEPRAVRRDPDALQRAIALMEANLHRPWTVTALARSVGMSRANFARKFSAWTGIAPLQYLTRCRMRYAAERLAQSDADLTQIATEVGYGSEFAFNRAFKRAFGVPPGQFRRSLTRSTALTFLAAA